MKTLPLPDYREVEIPISKDIIVSQVAAFLYAAGYVNDDEEVIDIIFNKEEINDTTVGTTLKIKKHQQVEVLNY